jgi:hypothetical protein
LAPQCPRDYGHGRLVLRRRLRAWRVDKPRLFWGCREWPRCDGTEDMTEEQLAYFERWRW